MYDLSQPNDAPGTCVKCRGTGTYSWGAVVNGKPTNSGQCYSCRGTGQQSVKQIKTNNAYNRYKVARIVASDFHSPLPDNGDHHPVVVTPKQQPAPKQRWREFAPLSAYED